MRENNLKTNKAQIYLDIAGVIFMVLNKKGEITLINKKGCEVLEYDEEELIGKNWFLTCLPDDIKNEVYDVFTKLMHGEIKATEFYENPILTKSGKEKIIAWHNTYFYDNDRNIDGTLSSGEDITHRKKTEQKLKESEEKFRRITEESHLAICILQDDVIKYINQKMTDLFGYTREEILNWKPGEYIKIFNLDSLDFVLGQKKKKQTGDPDIITHYPIHCIKKSGELFWVDNISKTITYKNGPADLITLIDITEHKKAEEERQNLEKLKSDFLDRASHELKTPLVSIIGYTDLFLHIYDSKLDEKAKEYINYIRKASHRLRDLSDVLIKAHKLDTETLGLKFSNANMSKLIKECVNAFYAYAKMRDVSISLDLQENLIFKFDNERIQDVINNLVLNALKYSPSGSSIKIQSKLENNRILISIKDHGIGVSKEEQQKIFQKFGKIEHYGKNLDIDIDGVGMGLYIAKKIVDIHNGRIWVESMGRNKGSTFYVSLPIE